MKLITFLSDSECNRLQTAIHDVKHEWLNRSGGQHPFFTLGAAIYLDSKDDNEHYEALAKQKNRFLHQHFSDLYCKLKAILEEELKAPVAYEERLALPGFHIFLFDKLFEQPLANIHFDDQFAQVDWSAYQEIDINHPISFTASISLPENGGGLNWWDLRPKDLSGLSEEKRIAKIQEAEQHYFAYKKGQLLLHDGLILHQIAPANKMVYGDERITLQGHGVFVDGIWRIYW